MSDALLITVAGVGAEVMRTQQPHLPLLPEEVGEEYARAYAETFYTIPDPDWRVALQAWQHFYEITPGKDFALLNLARVHMKLGNKPEALATLSKVQAPELEKLKTRLRERIETE